MATETLRLGCALCAALLSSAAWADPQDIQLYKLGNPDAGEARHDPAANANFRIFARELAAAITSVNLTPPETLGHRAFAVNAELSVAYIRTRHLGFAMPFASAQPFDGPLLIPSVHVRKGLPFSLELGGRAGWVDKSRMFTGTVELKWAITEGFAYIPDVALRGYGTRLFNSREMSLGSTGLDLGVGKQFAIGGMVTLTPYAGWNLVWVSASTGPVDFEPERTAAAAVASPNAQLDNATAYEDLRGGSNSHNRFYGGFRFIGGPLQLGAEISYSSLGTIRVADASDPSGTRTVGLPPLVALNSTLGLDF